jgi:hypothetical protein
MENLFFLLITKRITRGTNKQANTRLIQPSNKKTKINLRFDRIFEHSQSYFLIAIL